MRDKIKKSILSKYDIGSMSTMIYTIFIIQSKNEAGYIPVNDKDMSILRDLEKFDIVKKVSYGRNDVYSLTKKWDRTVRNEIKNGLRFKV